MAKHCAAANKTYCLNLSAPFLCQFFKDQLASVLPFTDILFGNETEAAAYAEAHNLGTSKVEEIALKLAMLPKENGSRSRLVVITQGSEPVITVQHGKVASWPVEKLESAAIVDTNGAGDAFVGGFLAQWVQVGWTVAPLCRTAVGCRGRSWRRQCAAATGRPGCVSSAQAAPCRTPAPSQLSLQRGTASNLQFSPACRPGFYLDLSCVAITVAFSVNETLVILVQFFWLAELRSASP